MERTLEILSFNTGLLDIRLFGRTLFEFTPHTRMRAHQLPGILEAYSPDILCLQEIYHASDFYRLTARLGKKYEHIARNPGKPRFTLNTGLAILSTFKIKDQDEIIFKRQAADEGIFAKKGYIYAVIEIPGNDDLLIINTHTTAGGSFHHPESDRISEIRLAQLQEVLQKVEQLKIKNWVLSGDLNCGPEASPENYQYLLSTAGAVDPVLILEKSSQIKRFVTWDPENPFNASSPHKTSPAQRIDHILFSNSLYESIEIDHFETVFTSDEFHFGENNQVGTISDHSGIKCSIILPGRITTPCPPQSVSSTVFQQQFPN